MKVKKLADMTIEELQEVLNNELKLADDRKKRNELIQGIKQARSIEEEGKHGLKINKENIKKVGKLLKDEITFYGTNVRENINKEQTSTKKKVGKGRKKEDNGYELVGGLV